MLAYFDSKKGSLEPLSLAQALPKTAVWIDLFDPSKNEEHALEQLIGYDIPTKEEMHEIELSSRLYRDNGRLYMTAAMIYQSDSPTPILDPVTFVLSEKQLITIRYLESQSFKLFKTRLIKGEFDQSDPLQFLINLLDTTIDRLADILEFLGLRLDSYSKTIFSPVHQRKEKMNYHHLMREIGINGDLNSKVRESLITFNRLNSFLSQSLGSKLQPENQLRTLAKDIDSLSDHANFLSSKVNFLLDATLGMVNIEQNKIIKIFSVAAVIFLPPTLVASIYGMNFHFIPELSWKYGYLFALGCIAFAAWLPYKYFKYRKWL